MSRRSDRAARREREQSAPAPEPAAAGGLGLVPSIALVIAAFGVGVLLAELFGAANLGVAFGIGQIAVALMTVWLILTR